MTKDNKFTVGKGWKIRKLSIKFEYRISVSIPPFFISCIVIPYMRKIFPT
jgi:hypothetical protein